MVRVMTEIEWNLSPLTEYELEQLVASSPPEIRRSVARLCSEVKRLRDEQAAREFAYEQEVEW